MRYKDFILANGWPLEDVPRINALMEADKWTEVLKEWRKLHE